MTPTTTLQNIPAVFRGMKQDYAAAKQGRFRRRRTGIDPMGSGADRHYRNESDFLRIMEYARDMDRNDAIVGQLVDRAVENTNQDGFTVDPKTGDDGLDRELKERFNAWADDPEQCDISGENTFNELADAAFRAMLVDGDSFMIGTSDGPLQFIEGHRCRTPSIGADENIVHGVKLNEYRRPLAYYFTKDDIDPIRGVTKKTQFNPPVSAGDGDGNRMVFHLANRARITQTRGVSAFAPIFDSMGMFEDLNFAKLVQAQIVSCIAIFREMSAGPGAIPGVTGAGQYGERTTETRADGSTSITENLAPGIEVTGKPGEKLQGFSPNVPNAEFFTQVKLILQIVGVNLGMPLVMVLLDASETNYSGWRGAVDQAQRGFRRNQTYEVRRIHTPVYRLKASHFAADDPKLAEFHRRLGPKFYAHKWNTPSWPYIDPTKDSMADAFRIQHRLTSPRRVHAERGQDYDQVLAETISDNSKAITAAITAAGLIEAQTKKPIDFRELLFLAPAMPIAPSTGEDESKPAPTTREKSHA